MDKDALEVLKQSAELASTGATGGLFGFFSFKEIFTFRSLFTRMIGGGWLGFCSFGIWIFYPNAVFISLIGAAAILGFAGISSIELYIKMRAKQE